MKYTVLGLLNKTCLNKIKHPFLGFTKICIIFLYGVNSASLSPCVFKIYRTPLNRLHRMTMTCRYIDISRYPNIIEGNNAPRDLSQKLELHRVSFTPRKTVYKCDYNREMHTIGNHSIDVLSIGIRFCCDYLD